MSNISTENTPPTMKDKILAGGLPKYHDKNAQQGKLFVRERLELLLDDGLQSEDGLYANCLAGDLPKMVLSLVLVKSMVVQFVC